MNKKTTSNAVQPKNEEVKVLPQNPVPQNKVRKVLQRDAVRFEVSATKGLSSEQVERRVETGLTNFVKARNSKSIPAII